MQLESLQIFCDIVKHRSFSRAAEEHGITQSAASQIVGQLEKRLRVQLINRSTRPLQLTSLGKTYYEGCQRLVEQYQEMEAAIRNTYAEMSATVRVAAIYSVGLGDMGQTIDRFHEMQPRVKIHMEYLHPDRVVERVLEGTVDFGLVSFPRATRVLAVLPWREEEMVLACAPGHPLAQLKALHLPRLANARYIGFDKNLEIRRQIDRFLRERDVPIEVVLEFDNIENIKKAVEVAGGVALLPEPTLRREVGAGTLVAVPLADGRLVRPLGILHHRHHKLSVAAARFIDLLRHTDGNGLAPPNTGAPAAPHVSHGPNGQARAPRKKKTTPI